MKNIQTNSNEQLAIGNWRLAAFRLLMLTFIIFSSPVGGGGGCFAQNVYQLQAGSFCPPPVGSGSLTGKFCFDIALGNDGTNSCGTLASRLATKADFTLPTTHTQTYTFTPSGTVSNVRFAYINTNGQVIIAKSGGNSGNNISTAVTGTINFNTDLNTLAAGTFGATALTADVYAIYNINATNDNNPANDRSVKLSVQVKDCACTCPITTSIGTLVFMCYNLGAETSTLNPFNYNGGAINGDLYQWGRPKDGHQVRTSTTTTTLSTTDVPGHGKFIVNTNIPYDWRSPQNNVLWGTTKTANDPCPAGFKVPSSAQWDAVIAVATKSWTGNGYAFGSPTSLYLPAAGFRSQSGSIINVALYGFYWSSTLSTVNPVNANNLYFSSTIAPSTAGQLRAQANSVRCIAE